MNLVVLRRRLFYISAMVLLLVPLYFLGNPSIRNKDGSVRRPGGTLAQIRTAYNLGQGDLGDIDPASESMRLATLGLRGVAATILWQKAEFYKKEQYWDRLSATLNQIAVLQPHFVKVWEFQSHNLSYNVSTEFDNYRHRYLWVKRGMDYLVKGSRYNKHRSEMPYELGWFFGNKFGVADERLQYRDLYREDENFHQDLLDKTGMDLTAQEGLGPDRKPDNWLSGRLWYERSYDMVEAGSEPARSQLMFYRMSPQWLMKYAEAIQTDGVLDEAARYAWERAGRGWREFGERQIRTSFGDTIYLTEIEVANQNYAEAKAEFEEFCGETYASMRLENEKMLTEEQRKAVAKPYSERTFDEVILATSAEDVLSIKPENVAKATPEDIRVEALQKAARLEGLQARIAHIDIYRNQINFPYWEQRCIAEQEDEALVARINMYEADQHLERGELDTALEKYEIAWANWKMLFDKQPAMMIDEAADNVMEAIVRYRRLLDEPELPEDFVLAPFLEFRQVYDQALADPAMMSVIASWPKNYPDRNFLDEMLARSRENYEAILPVNEEASPGESIEMSNAATGTAPTPKPVQPEDANPSEAETTEAETTEPEATAPDAGNEPSPPGTDSQPNDVNQPDESSQASDSKQESDSNQADTSSSLKVSAPSSGSAPTPKGQGDE